MTKNSMIFYYLFAGGFCHIKKQLAPAALALPDGPQRQRYSALAKLLAACLLDSDEELRNQIKEISAKLDQYDEFIGENTKRIERNHRMLRSLNLRIYGFDYAQAKRMVQLENGSAICQISKPHDLFLRLIVEGFHQTAEEARSLLLRSIDWTGSDDRRCILLLSKKIKRNLINGSAPKQGV
ncbi:unnamed protein product [Gongylonema pulchrum]|uniref:KH_dom_type_1 domain-containing protein n=1 Tax=Gongylonema pulchrum TaxID=637853 RepID=A0A183DMS4_9BILA|nr:unnamed protein product [Gongylonema pulchrum]